MNMHQINLKAAEWVRLYKQKIKIQFFDSVSFFDGKEYREKLICIDGRVTGSMRLTDYEKVRYIYRGEIAKLRRS